MTINNIVVTVTDDFVDANKDLFDIEYPPSDLDKYKAELDIHKHWLVLEKVEPRLYWLKIFQLIAEDINRVEKEENTKHFIMKEMDSDRFCSSPYSIKSHTTVRYNLVYFNTRKGAAKAQELMGNKINYVV